jgi:hypothetical protein
MERCPHQLNKGRRRFADDKKADKQAIILKALCADHWD